MALTLRNVIAIVENAAKTQQMELTATCTRVAHSTREKLIDTRRIYAHTLLCMCVYTDIARMNSDSSRVLR